MNNVIAITPLPQPVTIIAWSDTFYAPILPFPNIYKDTASYTECTICLEPKGEEEYSILRPCGHSGFCALCLSLLQIQQCPRCRRTMELKEKEKDYSLAVLLNVIHNSGCLKGHTGELHIISNKEDPDTSPNNTNDTLYITNSKKSATTIHVTNGIINIHLEGSVTIHDVNELHLCTLPDHTIVKTYPIFTINGQYSLSA